jgi:DnaJ-class molecular chaperone
VGKIKATLYEDCPVCKGEGHVKGKECKKCDGTGMIYKEEEEKFPFKKTKL